MAHEYLPKRLGCSESLRQYWGGSHRWGGQRGHPHYPLPILSPIPSLPDPLLRSYHLFIHISPQLQAVVWGPGSRLGDLGWVWLMNNGVRPTSCLFPAFTQSRGPRRSRETRLLNYNQHFVVLIRLACSHFPAVPLHTDTEKGGMLLTGRDGIVTQAAVPWREKQADR